MITGVGKSSQHAAANCRQQHNRQAVPGYGHRRRRRASNGHDGPYGEIDPAGGDHQRHADRQQRDRCGTVKNVDRAAEQPPILQNDLEKMWRNQAVSHQHQDQRKQLRHTRRPAYAPLRLAGLRKGSGHHTLLLMPQWHS